MLVQHREYQQSDLQFVTNFMAVIFHLSCWMLNYKLLQPSFRIGQTTLTDVIEQLKKLTSAERELLSEVCTRCW